MQDNIFERRLGGVGVENLGAAVVADTVEITTRRRADPTVRSSLFGDELLVLSQVQVAYGELATTAVFVIALTSSYLGKRSLRNPVWSAAHGTSLTLENRGEMLSPNADFLVSVAGNENSVYVDRQTLERRPLGGASHRERWLLANVLLATDDRFPCAGNASPVCSVAYFRGGSAVEWSFQSCGKQLGLFCDWVEDETPSRDGLIRGGGAIECGEDGYRWCEE